MPLQNVPFYDAAIVFVAFPAILHMDLPTPNLSLSLNAVNLLIARTAKEDSPCEGPIWRNFHHHDVIIAGVALAVKVSARRFSGNENVAGSVHLCQLGLGRRSTYLLGNVWVRPWIRSLCTSRLRIIRERISQAKYKIRHEVLVPTCFNVKIFSQTIVNKTKWYVEPCRVATSCSSPQTLWVSTKKEIKSVNATGAHGGKSLGGQLWVKTRLQDYRHEQQTFDASEQQSIRCSNQNQ